MLYQQVQEFEDLFEAGDRHRLHFIICGKDRVYIGADFLSVQRHVFPVHAEGIALADQPVSDAPTFDQDRHAPIEKAAALAHLVNRFIGLKRPLGALAIRQGAAFPTLFGLLNQLANFREIAWAGDELSVGIDYYGSGTGDGGEAVLQMLQRVEIKLRKATLDGGMLNARHFLTRFLRLWQTLLPDYRQVQQEA